MPNVRRWCFLIAVCFSLVWHVCNSDGVMIRHGRSRVRHSSEKAARWSSTGPKLSADNFTHITFHNEVLPVGRDESRAGDGRRFDDEDEEDKIIHIEPFMGPGRNPSNFPYYPHPNRFSLRKKHDKFKAPKLPKIQDPTKLNAGGVEETTGHNSSKRPVTNDVAHPSTTSSTANASSLLSSSSSDQDEIVVAIVATGGDSNDLSRRREKSGSENAINLKGQNNSGRGVSMMKTRPQNFSSHHLSHSVFKDVPRKRQHNGIQTNSGGEGVDRQHISSPDSKEEKEENVVEHKTEIESLTSPTKIPQGRTTPVTIPNTTPHQDRHHVIDGDRGSTAITPIIKSSARTLIGSVRSEDELELPDPSQVIDNDAGTVSNSSNNTRHRHHLPKTNSAHSGTAVNSGAELVQPSITQTPVLSGNKSTPVDKDQNGGFKEDVGHPHQPNKNSNNTNGGDPLDLKSVPKTDNRNPNPNPNTNNKSTMYLKQNNNEDVESATEPTTEEEMGENMPDIGDEEFNPSGLYSVDDDELNFQTDSASGGDDMNIEMDNAKEGVEGDDSDVDEMETNLGQDRLADLYHGDDIDFQNWDETSRNNRLNLMKGRDVVTKFLQIVETQHLLGANCTAGTDLNLGEGVVDQYAQERFRVSAEFAVNRANMLTRIFKFTDKQVQMSEHLLHASVLSMVEFDDDIFAAGNCFDWNQHPAQKGLFCPFAYRLPPPDQGASFAKNLAKEYYYLGNTSEWFWHARKNAEKVIDKNEQYIKAYHLYSNSTTREADEILSVKYEDGRWSKPYYDCGGGNIWMLTYTVPFFGFDNGTYFFKGTSGIDIDLRRVDIDQCPQRISATGLPQPLNIFAGTDKCKQRTTECEAISGMGFRRGSYKCVCRRGFYFPDTTIMQKYFNGSTLEEEYEKLMLGETSMYSDRVSYECLPCAEGCDSCKDASPCVAALNWPMRTSILVMACAIIGLLPPAALFTFKYQQVKVVRAASPALLRVIALGAFFIYCTTIVLYPNPSLYTCTARVWLREIGFSLTYGALMLKTWRISVIFRVRSAKAVKITDASLLKRLGILCGAVGAFLLIRTIVAPPRVVVGRTTDDLKAFLCKTDWWDHTFTSMEVLFLAWGVRLCIMVRKAPSEFNESRFISMAIYNEFLLTCFLNVSMLFLQSPANPDLLFIIFFCHTQLTVTLLLALIFGSKVYLVFRGGGKSEDSIGLGSKPSGAKFICRSQARTFGNPSTATSSTAQLGHYLGTEGRLSEQEALDEIKSLFVELQRIQERAPPRGVAGAVIAALLESCRANSQLTATLRPPVATKAPLPLDAVPVIRADKATNTNTDGEEHWYQINNGGTRIAITDETDKESIKLLRKCLESCPTLTTSAMDVKQPLHQTTSLNHQRHIRDELDAVNGLEKSLSINADTKSSDLDFANLQLECMCSSDSIIGSPSGDDFKCDGFQSAAHNHPGDDYQCVKYQLRTDRHDADDKFGRDDAHYDDNNNKGELGGGLGRGDNSRFGTADRSEGGCWNEGHLRKRSTVKRKPLTVSKSEDFPNQQSSVISSPTKSTTLTTMATGRQKHCLSETNLMPPLKFDETTTTTRETLHGTGSKMVGCKTESLDPTTPSVESLSETPNETAGSWLVSSTSSRNNNNDNGCPNPNPHTISNTSQGVVRCDEPDNRIGIGDNNKINETVFNKLDNVVGSVNSRNNNINNNNNSITTTTNISSSNNTKESKKVLDLNDKSKYTKEVSV